MKRGPSFVRWRPEELRVLNRHLSALARREFGSMPAAARACRAELARRGGPPRTLLAVSSRMFEYSVLRGLSWPRIWWSPTELSVVRRYARAVVRGKYPSARAAVPDCQRALARLERLVGRRAQWRPAVSRPDYSVEDQMRQAAHALGWSRQRYAWSPAEDRVLLRHVRWLFEGRFRDAPEAAAACKRALERLLSSSRTAYGILLRLKTEAARVHLPRRFSPLSPAALETVVRYARAASRGEYPGWKEAARACRVELRKSAAAEARRSSVPVRRVVGQSLHTIYTQVLDAAHRLKLPGPRRVLWTPTELRVCASWVRWYDRHRIAPLRRGFWKATVDGLQEELENLGSRRSFGACEYQLRKVRRRLHGMA